MFRRTAAAFALSAIEFAMPASSQAGGFTFSPAPVINSMNTTITNMNSTLQLQRMMQQTQQTQAPRSTMGATKTQSTADAVPTPSVIAPQRPTDFNMTNANPAPSNDTDDFGGNLNGFGMSNTAVGTNATVILTPQP